MNSRLLPLFFVVTFVFSSACGIGVGNPTKEDDLTDADNPDPLAPSAEERADNSSTSSEITGATTGDAVAEADETDKATPVDDGELSPTYSDNNAGNQPSSQATVSETFAGNQADTGASDQVRRLSLNSDTESYTKTLQMVIGDENETKQIPSAAEVEVEDFINAFDQGYASDDLDGTIEVHIDGAPSPFHTDRYQLRIGIVSRERLPSDNVVATAVSSTIQLASTAVLSAQLYGYEGQTTTTSVTQQSATAPTTTDGNPAGNFIDIFTVPAYHEGQSSTLFYELELADGSDEIGTIFLEYNRSNAEGIVETSSKLITIRRSQFYPTFETAPKEFRITAISAEFARLIARDRDNSGDDLLGQFIRMLTPMIDENSSDNERDLLRLIEQTRDIRENSGGDTSPTPSTIDK